MALLILLVSGHKGKSKSKCAILDSLLNFKIFARGQSPARKVRVFLSRLSCQGEEIFLYVLNCHVVNGLPITKFMLNIPG